MKINDFSKIKVKFVSRGQAVKVRRLKEGHIPEISEFNFAIVEFANFFDDVKDCALPISRRRKKSTKKFRVLSYESPKKIIPSVETITRLANMQGKPYKDAKKRFKYQEALAKIYSIMIQEAWQEGINDTLGLLLERGALLIGALYNYPADHLARIVAKRLDYEEGQFGLGLSDLRLPQNVKSFKKLHLQEDCIATGDSIAGTILALKEQGFLFDEVQIDAAMVTQTGAGFLMEYLNFLGVKQVVVKAGALCYKLDDHFYLRRTKEEGYDKNEYFVGDMGEWSRLLPKEFDKIAWWNKNRLDCR